MASGEMTKRCTKCKVIKPFADYGPSKTNRDGLKGWCKPCMRGYVRDWQKANLDRHRGSDRRYRGWRPGEHERAEEMLPSVRCCDICAKTDPGGKGWQADHSHTTGLFRGFLCGQCNKAIGLFKDDIARLDAAKKYLRKALTRARKLGITSVEEG